MDPDGPAVLWVITNNFQHFLKCRREPSVPDGPGSNPEKERKAKRKQEQKEARNFSAILSWGGNPGWSMEEQVAEEVGDAAE